VTAPGSVWWFARHELRLAWREALSLLTARGRRRWPSIVLSLAVAAGALHLAAFFAVARYAEIGEDADERTLLAITASLLLAWSLMLSQAMEWATRALYARGDFDLILSSPADPKRLFAVRIAATTLGLTTMAALIALPFVDVLVAWGGWRWLGVFGAVAAVAMSAAAVGTALTLTLFRLIGAKRTRLVAQIVAAVIGAIFVILLQLAAIVETGTLSRLVWLSSPTALALAPARQSLLWWPARAVLGEAAPLAAVLGASALLLALVLCVLAGRFTAAAREAAGAALSPPPARRHAGRFRRRSPGGALRAKEWALLRRDPWLLSQTLMQLLYLVPPAVLLWRSFGDGSGALVLLVPVLIMAAGQLAGGLAWLAVSGEDAPDLVTTAPVTPRRVLVAKIEAVLGGIVLIFAPFIAALTFASLEAALIVAAGVALAALSATVIQLWFRHQAKRSHFRRRQTSSRIATVAEAFSSTSWAATGALAAAGTWFAAITAVMALLVLGAARLVAPARG
jgi:ABC-2 type transport system permease protein